MAAALKQIAAGGLHQRLEAISLEHGVLADPASVGLLIDFAQSVLSADLGIEISQVELQVFAVNLSARCAMPIDLTRDLLEAASDPVFRERHSRQELAAFRARFGDATAALVSGEQRSVDLAGFGRRYGSADSLLLLDSLLSVLKTHERIDEESLDLIEGAAGALGVGTVLFRNLLRKHGLQKEHGEYVFELVSDDLQIGRSGCEILLNDPQVAPTHATLVRVNGAWEILALCPLMLNGQLIESASLRIGDRLTVGPFTLWLSEDRLLEAELSRGFSTLSVRGLNRTIRSKGQDIALLTDVSFTVFSGEVIAIVGPSGAGKTTLINAITGPRHLTQERS